MPWRGFAPAVQQRAVQRRRLRRVFDRRDGRHALRRRQRVAAMRAPPRGRRCVSRPTAATRSSRHIEPACGTQRFDLRAAQHAAAPSRRATRRRCAPSGNSQLPRPSASRASASKRAGAAVGSPGSRQPWRRRVVATRRRACRLSSKRPSDSEPGPYGAVIAAASGSDAMIQALRWPARWAAARASVRATARHRRANSTGCPLVQASLTAHSRPAGEALAAQADTDCRLMVLVGDARSSRTARCAPSCGTAAARPAGSWPALRASADRPRRCPRRTQTRMRSSSAGIGPGCRACSVQANTSRTTWLARRRSLAGSTAGLGSTSACATSGRPFGAQSQRARRANPRRAPARRPNEDRSAAPSSERPAEDQRTVAAAKPEAVAHGMAQFGAARLHHHVQPERGSSSARLADGGRVCCSRA